MNLQEGDEVRIRKPRNVFGKVLQILGSDSDASDIFIEIIPDKIRCRATDLEVVIEPPDLQAIEVQCAQEWARLNQLLSQHDSDPANTTIIAAVIDSIKKLTS